MTRKCYSVGTGFLLLVLHGAVTGQDLPGTLPDIPYHLTARPWQPLDITEDPYLETIAGICRVAAQFQDDQGAIIDPYLHREHQYSTPYFAFAVGTLLQAGYGQDLLQAGTKAMAHATACFAEGHNGIPDGHGEFFIAPLSEALGLYRDFVPDYTYER